MRTGNTIHRAFQIVSLFQRNRMGFTPEQLGKELNVTVRTAYRYIEGLACHFPIVKDSPGPGRYRLMERS